MGSGPDRLGIRDLARLGLTPTVSTVRQYAESQRTVYDVAGRTIADLLEATGAIVVAPVDRQLLADAMTLMRYADDMIDIYGVSEVEFAQEVDKPGPDSPISDMAIRTGPRFGDLCACLQALLAASQVQRSCSDAYYAALKGAEGEAAADVLWSLIKPSCEPERRAELHAFLRALSAAANLWDALWDRGEDNRRGLRVAVSICAELAVAISRLARTAKSRARVTVTLARMIHRYYLTWDARNKWHTASPQESWRAHQREHARRDV